MADAVCRVLRDGALEGEHATSLTINDSVDSPFGPTVFHYVFTQLSSFISSGKSQSRGIVLVTFSRSPSFTAQLLENRGIDVAGSHEWLRVLDCYTDPLGWKERLKDHGVIKTPLTEASLNVTVCKDVRKLDDLFSQILTLGKGLVGDGKNRFSVAIDSLTEMIRHTSLSSVACLLSNLRSHAQVSSIFWLLHSDLHDLKAVAAFEYMSSMVANVKPLTSENTDKFYLLEQSYKRGQFHASLKRRNGRVRVMREEFSIENSLIKFTSIAYGENAVAQSLVPKVQFNLQLSDKERSDRAKVVLPFEHQETEKSVQIYDGRKSDKHESNGAYVENSKKQEDSGRGEIIYFRDSDDEMPDSDEDPDDDLDI
ncbi:putative elongator complex protein [Helianthus annuus]|uniref:Elongator complex protein 5 n=1 Tax=Helianthus annuus TaxID=4232 RepID=A0A251T4A6_HELAN|nr:elongator complex protein 5 [Helianthus annuus]KAF5778712.1 putative elongator complex protein [Helianthus annuus]KAJ0490074.1 putative elongator complex protein [Helianthus annuus]KAJ0494163.1 putative elongator complex protein [Helianthus annuus]KAJ0505986.1 putative elongator complex protein [Helianthus annuus]KAJ0675657.1 putative elongator complex protein [Helianthus annuus]